MLTQRGIIDSKATMGNTPTNVDTTPLLLDEVAGGLRLLRERLEAGKARWSMALVETRYAFAAWRWDVDAKVAGRSGEWVSWLNTPTALALAAETEWVLEVVNPNNTTVVDPNRRPHITVRSGTVDRFATDRTPASLVDYLREIGDGSGFVLQIPFAGDRVEDAALALPFGTKGGMEWASWCGPPGPTMAYDRKDGRPERPALKFDHNGVRGVVFVGVGPLRVSPGEPRFRSAAWTLAVGLRFEGEPPTPDQAEGLWEHLDDVLAAAGWDRLERGTRSRLETTETPSTSAVQRFINNAPSKVDPVVANLLRALQHQRLAIDSSAMRPWDTLVEEEVERLQRDEGEAAFKKIPGIRDALLRWVTLPGKTRAARLTKEAERDLVMREGRKGYRRTYGDMEFLERVVPVAGTDRHMSVRLSWQRIASVLSPDYRHQLAQQLQREEEEDRESLIPSPEAERSRRRRRIEALGSFEDASRILQLCLQRYGSDPKAGFRVSIPRWEIAALLGIKDDDSEGLRRIKSALGLLMDFRVGLTAEWKGGGGGEGVVVSGYVFGDAKDTGTTQRGNPHADIDTLFRIDITPHAVGALSAYYLGGAPKDAKEPRYIESTTLAPWVEGAARFTATQSRLWEWVRGNLTRKRDSSTVDPVLTEIPGKRKKAGARRFTISPSADTSPREYGGDFCPLLPQGGFFGALGRFKNRPEAGFTLKGALIKAMGYDLPKKGVGRTRGIESALADLDTVVVKTFGGVVAGRIQDGRWIGLEEVQGLSTKTAEAIPLFIFIPKDYAKREAAVVETHQRERKDRGDTKVEIKVADSPEAYAEANPTTDSDEAFRLQVVEARKRLGITQAVLASIIGTNQSHLSRWEKGKGGLRLDTRERLKGWVAEASQKHALTP